MASKRNIQKNTTMIKPSPSKNEPQLSKSQQRISKNEPSKSVQTLEKSGIMQNNNYGTGDEKQKPGQKQNIGQTSKMPNTMSKFQVIPSKNDGRNGKAINNISKSLPTGQLKSIQGLQNVVPPGQTSKTKNDLSKSQIISSKNKQMDTTTNNLVKSMPAAQLNNLKGRQDLDKKSQQQRLNRPQPDGQVSKNQTGQKSTTKTESIQAQGQKSGMLPANMQKSQQQQNRPNNSQTSYQKGLPPLKQQNTVNKGQQNQDKAGNLVSNKMTSQPNTQKSVNQQSRVQQNTQNLAKQSNTFPKVSQNAENQQNNSQKNQLRQQKLGNQANNLQKTQTNTPKPANKPNKPNGQMKGNPADIVKTSIESGQKPGKQQNDLKKGMNPLKPANTGKSIQNYGNTGRSNQNAVDAGKSAQNTKRSSQNVTIGGKPDKTASNTGRSSQTAGNTGKSQNTGKRGPGDKDKKKKKQLERRNNPVRPQIIEYPAGVTTIPLPELQVLLDEIEEMRGDRNYSALVEFLSQLLQKVQNLETGNYSRTEIELFVRQFQDYNEGFHYRMDSKSRGHALILTNYEFYQVPGDPWSYDFKDRPGAEIDADKMEDLLLEMGYLVTRRDNLKHWEMEWEIKLMTETDHRKFDSFMCIISSHGNVNQVYGCDGLRVILNKQIRRFRSGKCPSLTGKPKLFFLQSCQAEEEDQTFRSESMVPTDAKPKPGELEKSRFLINDVDFLVGYSTLPGYLSYRHEQTGSWYLNALYENLKENSKQYDIVTILEDVNFDVSCKKDQYNYLDSNQVSMFSSTLRGPLFFQ
ncbi:CASP8 [Mytilus edulis]|uniref:CASP8 n=1 Tax=Mytilus edulis TaxID=6550 RepID=A0A8S3R9Y8_MYTED|nr:CASP8 [Mytilus edulis]